MGKSLTGARHTRILSAIAVLTLLAPLMILAPGPAAAQASSTATVSTEVCYLIQGENEMLPGVQSNHDFFSLRIISYDLPFNDTRIFTDVPRTARNLSVVNPSAANYGWESSGPMAGRFYVDVPSGYSREGTPINHTEIAAQFMGGTLVNTTYSSGSLRLSANATEGTADSANISVDCTSIISANLSAYGLNMTNVSGQLSNDGGLHWVPVSGTSEVQFPYNGSDLRVRLALRGNATQGGDPKVTGFSTRIRYTAVSVPFTVHISYLWTPSVSDGVVTLNATEPLGYSQGGSLVLMVYLVKGYTASADGVALRLDTTGSFSDYPDKDLYFNMTTFAGGLHAVTISVHEPPAAPIPWGLYIGSLALVALFVGAFVFLRHQRMADVRRPSSRSVEGGVPDKAAPSSRDAVRRDELIERKKAVLSKMEGIRSKRSEGSISKTDADRDLDDLKKELKGVRNELNKLPRRAQAEPDVAPVASASEYDSLMVSLARIDDDFEKGRLPESAYKSVRKEYLTKAARILTDRKAAEVVSPLEAEKRKLMEALVSLDKALDNEEIDQKVHADLSASYKKELAVLMKRIDDSKGG